MSLRTVLTESLSIQHPIVLAPMGGCAGGALAAAVSNGGGLGLVGGGRGDRDWLARELALVAEQTTKPWGIGFLSWAVDVDTVVRVLEHQPVAMMFSFGDPGPFAERVRSAGVMLIVQVTDLDEAQRALDVGADVIVAQGSEAGGHGGRRATLPLVPAVVDLAAFQASLEALVPAEVTKALIEGRGSDTERSRVLDIARGAGWPARYTARTLRNAFLDRWRDREDELSIDGAAQRAYTDAAARGDPDVIPVWASEAVDLITEVGSATDLVAALAAEAERALARAGNR